MMPPKSIVVLGGGLSGLSSAFHLARRFPATPITLLERSNHLGGWVRSDRIDIRDSKGDKARILVESGPRTLRPNGKSVLELINLLGLKDSIITVPKSAPAATTRFLHIPGTHGLTPLPNSLLSIFTSSIRNVLLGGVLGEPYRARVNRGQALGHEYNDMSFDAFLTYHFGQDFARILGSALAHGVYAADSRLVSTRAAFPSMWSMAGENGRQSIAFNTVKRMLGLRKASGNSGPPSDDYELGDVEKRMNNASVFSFKDGLETLVQSLERRLAQRSNVAILRSRSVVSISKNADTGNFMVSDTLDTIFSCSHIVSTIPLPALHKIIEISRESQLEDPEHLSPPELPHLLSNPSSSVTVVSLVFPPSPDGSFYPDGFGYLVPRKNNDTQPGDVDFNSLEHRLLGVVFDSCALSEQDYYPTDGDAKARFTKMTLMLKGVSATNPPSEEDILALLSNHLTPKAPIPKPVFMRVHAHENCIPIPTVGHMERISELQRVLEDRKEGEYWMGRFAVLGAGVGGVSVPDCIEQGRRVALQWSLQ